jgi:hypothetical protein
MPARTRWTVISRPKVSWNQSVFIDPPFWLVCSESSLPTSVSVEWTPFRVCKYSHAGPNAMDRDFEAKSLLESICIHGPTVLAGLFRVFTANVCFVRDLCIPVHDFRFESEKVKNLKCT